MQVLSKKYESTNLYERTVGVGCMEGNSVGFVGCLVGCLVCRRVNMFEDLVKDKTQIDRNANIVAIKINTLTVGRGEEGC